MHPTAVGGEPHTAPHAASDAAGADRDRVGEQSGLRGVLANISWLWVDSLVALVASLIGGIVVARALGPSGYGVLGYASGLMGMALPIAGLGLADVAVRDLVARDSPPGRILGTTLALQSAGSLLAFALSWVASRLLNDASLTQRVTVVVSLSILATPTNVPGYWFAARVRSKYAVWARGGALLACTVARVALARSGAPILAFAWLAAIQAFLAGLILLGLSRGRMPALSAWEFSFRDAMRLLQEGWPLLASSLAVALCTKIDLVMLGKLTDAVAVGQYAAAVRLSELTHIVPTAIAISIFPALIRVRGGDAPPGGPARFMQSLYDMMAGLGGAIALLFALLARPAASVLYGVGYAQTGQILAVHVWSLVFVCLGMARGRWLVASGNLHVLFYTGLLGAVANAGLNLFLIPRYGAMGAAWAALVSQSVANYFSCLLWPALREPCAQMTRALLLPFRLPSAWRGITTIWKGSAIGPATDAGRQLG